MVNGRVDIVYNGDRGGSYIMVNGRVDTVYGDREGELQQGKWKGGYCIYGDREVWTTVYMVMV